MKTLLKTAIWTLISAGLFFCSAYFKGVDIETAAVATLIAVGAETPFYSLFEFLFEKMYGKDKLHPVCVCQWATSEDSENPRV